MNRKKTDHPAGPTDHPERPFPVRRTARRPEQRPASPRSGPQQPFYSKFERSSEAATRPRHTESLAPEPRSRNRFHSGADSVERHDQPYRSGGQRFPASPDRRPVSRHTAYPQHQEGASQQVSGPAFASRQRIRVPAPWQHRETATQRARRLQAEVLRTPIRLNRFIAQSGLCSRREADDYIQKGMVKVNGKVVTDFSTHVQFDRDLVTVNGRAVDPQKLVYILLNKPKNHLCTLHDPQGRRTVMDLVRNVTHERIFPVGRLDRNTTGVLLLTNDGDMAKKLTHPSYEIKKVYHVRLNQPIPLEHLDLIMKGLELEDGPIKADFIDYQPGKDFNEVVIEIHSGRNRIVRRIFEHLGYEVEALDRVAVGPLTKKGLARGHHRFLSEKEVGFLYMMLGNRKPKPQNK